MSEKATLLDTYLEQSGQSMQELMSGASQYGIGYVLDKLVPKAIDEKKKIVWITEDARLGLGRYELQ